MTRNVYTVGQVNAYIKNMFTQDYMLNRIYVKGEVSNCKYHTSGHIYFSLKDESGTIACVMFAGQRGGLSFRMCEGQQIVVFGQVNVMKEEVLISYMQEKSVWTEKVFFMSVFRLLSVSWKRWECLLRNIRCRFLHMHEESVL